MKNLLLILALSLLPTFSALPVFARDGGEISVGNPPVRSHDVSEELLNHNVVKGALALLNASNAGSCRLPEKEGIRWMCLGAIPPVKEPTIFPSSCGFSFTIECDRTNVEISGRTQSYMLVSPKPNKVKPTEKEIIIDNMTVIQKP